MIFAPGAAMNQARMRRPAAVRIGMFCRLGSLDAKRPVTAVVCEYVVCTRPVAGLMLFGSLSV